MSKLQDSSISGNLKYDVPASIVVFLVAVPLCLGIALASGAPLFSGIISGIVGGIVVTLISKSSLGVSGPAAGLAVIVLTAIQDLGDYQVFLLAVVLAGIIQIILGFAKAGIIGYFFPSSVIKGMLSGIGIIIFLKQIPHAFGYDADPEGDLSFVQPDGHNTFSELYYMLDFINPGAIIIASLSLAILIFWESSFMKKFKIFQIVQGPLIVVVLGIILQQFFAGYSNFALQGNQLVTVPVSNNLGEFFGQFTLPDFSALTNPEVYIIAVTLAIVASLETLLSVEATDKLDPYKRVTPTSRELLAQGVGNTVAGLIGGLPVTQVIVRSSANVQSGGRTRFSAFLHGILLFVSALALPRVLNMIPLSSLAAILMVVGFKLAKPSVFKAMAKMGRDQFVPFMVTIIGVVFTDLLVGIGLGMGVAFMYILYNNYKTPYHFHIEQNADGHKIKITLSEDVTFLNKAAILKSLDLIPDNSKVTIDKSRAKYIHPDVLEIMEDFEVSLQNRNIELQYIDDKMTVPGHSGNKFNKQMVERKANS